MTSCACVACPGWPVASSADPHAGAGLAEVIAAFGHLLHRAGVPVTPERSGRFAAAITLAAPQSLPELARLGRTTLVSSRDQIPIFDRVFAQVFGGFYDPAEFRGEAPPSQAPPPEASSAGERSPGEPKREVPASPSPLATSAIPDPSSAGETDGEDPAVLAAVSQQERLTRKDFADCTPEELALLARLVEALPFVPPLRITRRERRHHAGSRLDVRATLRAAHRTAGDPVRRVHRRRQVRPRRLVLIADVSGSMEPYARIYLHLMRGAVRALGSEAFVFATELTRLTRSLGHTQPDVAYRRAAEAAPDWSGGTRIGRALQAFVDGYGRRGMARGAVVVIVSDGWEIEDPRLVERAMTQLHRLAFHVIWVNPRKAAQGYAPLVGGMAAALPSVDTFVSGHSVHAIEEVMSAVHRARSRHEGSRHEGSRHEGSRHEERPLEV